jgi:GT2 family glycosyltransferase
MKVGIGFAAYIANDEHFRYAVETLDSVQSAEHEISFCGVANFIAKEEYNAYVQSKGDLLFNPENNVSMGWNRATRHLLAAGCDYVIVPNLDIVFKSDLVDNLVRYAEKTKDQFILWTALPWNDLPSLEQAVEHERAPETPHFSCYMVDNRLFNRVGEFDENFRPAYNEDLDMHWRIVLAGETAVGYEGARFFHHGSRTIQSDPELLQRNHITHDLNNQYFVRKWGYKPPTAADEFLTKEMYRTPFDRGF